MKQTASAITFLMAQYRAIFKHAYLKGLAPAILLTTGLAAGQAQAAAFDWDNAPQSGDSGVELVSGTSTYTNAQALQEGAGKTYVFEAANLGQDGDNYYVASSSGGQAVTNNATIYMTSIGGKNKVLQAYSGDITNNGEIYFRTTESGSVWGSQALYVNHTNNAVNNNLIDVTNAIAMGFGSEGNGSKLVNSSGATINVSGMGVGMDMASKGLNSAENKIENYGTINADGIGAFGIRVADGTTNGSVYNNGTIAATNGAYSIAVAGATNINVVLEGDSQITNMLVGDQNAVTFRNNNDELVFSSSSKADATASTLTLVDSQITFLAAKEGAKADAEEQDAASSSATLSEINLDATSLLTNQGKINFTGSELNVSDAQFDGLTQGNLTISADATVEVTGDKVWDLTAGESGSGLGTLDDNGALAQDGNFVIGADNNVTFKAGGVQLGSAYKASNLALDVGTLNVAAGEKNRFIFSSGSITVHDELNGAAATDRFVIKALGADDTATLHLDATNGSGTITNIDRFNVGFSNQTSGDSILKVDGTWDFGDARIVAGQNGQVQIDGTANNVSALMLEKSGLVVVNGALTIERLMAGEANSSDSKLDINGTLTITGDGDLTDEGADVNKTYFNDVQLTETSVSINNGGRLTISGEDAVEDIFSTTKDDSGNVIDVKVEPSGDKEKEQGGWDNSKVTLNAGATLEIDLAATGLKTISSNKLSELKSALVKDGYKGSFDFGQGITIELGQDLTNAINSGSVSYDQLVSAGVNDVQNATAGKDNVVVSISKDNAEKGINLSAGASSIALSGTESVKVAGSLMLSNNGGDFVTTSSEDGQTSIGKVVLTSNSGVNLTGAGTVGSLTKDTTDGDVSDTSAVLNAGAGATQKVQGEINLDKVSIGTGTVSVTGNVTAGELVLTGDLNNFVDLSSATTKTGGEAEEPVKTGYTTTATTLNQSAGSTLTTNKLQIGANGSEGTDSAINGLVNADSIIINAASDDSNNTVTIAGHGKVVADTFTGTSGAIINVGTDGNGDAATSSPGTLEVGTLNLSGATLTIDPIYGMQYAATIVKELSQDNTLDGSVEIGQNALLAVGFDDAAKVTSFLADNKLLAANGSLKQEAGALLIVNKAMTIGSDAGITLDGNELKDTADNTLTINEGGAVVITEGAFGGRDDKGVLGSGTAISFEADSGSVTSSGGKVLLAGSFYADDFADNDKQLFSGTNISITDGLELTSTNGLLKGEISSGGTISNVHVDTDKVASTLNQASAPVQDLIVTALEGKDVKNKTAFGANFLADIGNSGNGQEAEAASRLAIYGGAVQSALMAQQTTTDAVAERIGFAKTNSSLVASSNGQGASICVSPVYKNQDSDGFAAQGVEYGADVNLYGVALGADFTTETGVRLGAMFNVGAGDADGQGVGSTVTNDFDYYGFALYAGVALGNFAVGADFGFTQLDNDLEQSYYGGKFQAETDAQVISMGVRGEYSFNTALFDIVPHVGLRYTSLDLDNYDIRGSGEVLASNQSQSLNIFSIPVGVTFSKDIAVNAWTIKPIFDLTLTANAGDDKMDSKVRFSGMDSISLVTEVMDNFTYGATLGVDAQSANGVSFGLNVGYTGSSNADEFGVNAKARYTF